MTVCLITAAFPLHLHNLHKQREGRTERKKGGLGAELQGAHVQLRLAMWRDKYGGMKETRATAGCDDYMLRHPCDMLIDSAGPHPSPCIYKAKLNRQKMQQEQESEHIRGALIQDHGMVIY